MQKLTLPPAGDLPQRGLFDLAGPVGREAANDRDDVIRAQLMLGAAGYLDPGRLPGPTGWPGDGLVRAIRAWQKDNGLTVDGVLMPEGWNGDPRNGETLRSLKTRHGEALTDMPVPTAAEVDARFERRKENNMAQRNALSIIVTGFCVFTSGFAFAQSYYQCDNPDTTTVAVSCLSTALSEAEATLTERRAQISKFLLSRPELLAQFEKSETQWAEQRIAMCDGLIADFYAGGSIQKPNTLACKLDATRTHIDLLERLFQVQLRRQ